MNMMETQPNLPEVAAATSADDDTEAQKDALAAEYNDEAGKCMGIIAFAFILASFVFGWISYVVSFLAFPTFGLTIAAIALSSVTTCGCCCTPDPNLSPKVRRWSTAALVCIIIRFILWIIVMISITGRISMSWLAFMALWVVSQLLCGLSGVFAGIFVWGRKCCGNA